MDINNDNNIYTFDSKLLSNSLTVGPTPKLETNTTYIDLIKGEYEKINFPVSFQSQYGSKLTDLLDAGFASLYLISENFKKILEDNNITGWKTFPIKLIDKKGKEITGYHGFSVTGRYGKIDYSKSEKVYKSEIPGGPTTLYYKGLYFESFNDNKVDIFMPENKLAFFINSKSYNKIKNYKISNFEMKDTNKILTWEKSLRKG